jgi:hypothetical protein
MKLAMSYSQCPRETYLRHEQLKHFDLHMICYSIMP